MSLTNDGPLGASDRIVHHTDVTSGMAIRLIVADVTGDEVYLVVDDYCYGYDGYPARRIFSLTDGKEGELTERVLDCQDSVRIFLKGQS